MSKIKILVTGNAIGGKQGPCSTCNIDFSWIFEHPSTLLWVDKIIITPYMKEIIESGPLTKEEYSISNAVEKIFEVAEDYNLIEIKNPKKIVDQELSERIVEEVMRDRIILSKLFPGNVKIDVEENVPGDIYIENKEFCMPYIWTIYTSLILSQKWDAQCLFSDHVMLFLKYKFGCSLVTNKKLNNLPKSFDTILSSYLPEFKFPYYIYKDLPSAQCKSCAHIKRCNDHYLADIETNLTKYLDLRDYEEINQVKKLLGDTVNSLESKNETVDYQTIENEFEEQKRIISRKIHSTFPKIKKWVNISLMASVPISMVGAYTGLPELSVVGTGITGLAALTKGYIEHIENKNKWIGFKTDNFIM